MPKPPLNPTLEEIQPKDLVPNTKYLIEISNPNGTTSKFKGTFSNNEYFTIMGGFIISTFLIYDSQ